MKVPLLLLAALCVPSFAHAQIAPPAKSAFEKQVTVDISRNRKVRTGGGDWDDKRDAISFKLKFANSDFNNEVAGFTGEFFVFGQSIVEPRAFKLLGRESFAISIPKHGVTEIDTQEVSSQWDNTGIKFGAKYDSWVLVVQDKTGATVMKKSSAPYWLPVAEKMSGLKVSAFYDRQLQLNKTVTR